MQNVKSKFTDEVVDYCLKKIDENYNTDELSKVQFSELLNVYQDLYHGMAVFEVREKGKPMYWLSENELRAFALVKIHCKADIKQMQLVETLFKEQGISVKQLVR